jgi:hypothetical protein
VRQRARGRQNIAHRHVEITPVEFSAAWMKILKDTLEDRANRTGLLSPTNSSGAGRRVQMSGSRAEFLDSIGLTDDVLVRIASNADQFAHRFHRHIVDALPAFHEFFAALGAAPDGGVSR